MTQDHAKLTERQDGSDMSADWSTSTFPRLPADGAEPLGWLGYQARQDAAGFVGQFRNVCAEAASNIYTKGRVDPYRHGSWLNGETEGNWADGYVRLIFSVGDDAAHHDAREYLRQILRHQDQDGYIGIYSTPERKELGKVAAGELWTQSRIFLALLAWHELDGADVVAAVHRAARHSAQAIMAGGDNPFAGDRKDTGPRGHGLMMVEALTQIFDLTADRLMIDFACYLYEKYSEADIGWIAADCQVQRLTSPEPFIGHGVHTCEHLRVPLLLYRYTGDDRYRTAYERAFAKILPCLGLAGACKSDECIGTPGLGIAPLPEFGYEYCAITELLISLHTKVEITGDLTAADRAEWLFMNAAQAGKNHDGRTIAYLLAENQYTADRATGTRWDYSPTHDDIAVCCPPNAARTVAYHTARMVHRTTDGGLAVLFYGPMRQTATIDGTRVVLEQQTEYPFSNEVTITITVTDPIAFPAMCRVPNWARDVTIEIDGIDAPDLRVMNDRIVVTTEWRGTATIRLTFAAEPALVQAVDGTWAVARGPLLYALQIPAESAITRKYGVGDFADIDHRPAASTRWDFTINAPADGQPIGQVLKRDTDPATDPWNHPPIEIRMDALSQAPHTDPHASARSEISLIPIGATTLRRTTFPLARTLTH